MDILDELIQLIEKAKSQNVRILSFVLNEEAYPEFINSCTALDNQDVNLQNVQIFPGRLAHRAQAFHMTQM